MSEFLFIEPLDALHLRGNLLFGGPGDHAETLMPPWPSVAAGAIRSRMLVDGRVDLRAFAKGQETPAATGLRSALGMPASPGSVRVFHFSLARRSDGRIEPLFPLPADLRAVGTGRAQSDCQILSLEPAKLDPEIGSSAALERFPVWWSSLTAKPLEGLWLDSRCQAAYLAGEPVKVRNLVHQGSLWAVDPRLGIAIDSNTRTAEKGRIYTSEGAAFQEGVGFLAGVQGADGVLPRDGLLRFGGDGRGAAVSWTAAALPEPPWERILSERRFRIFPGGWIPPGFELKDGRWLLQKEDISCCLVAAAVARAGVVSGWDLASQRPKTARRAAAAGSVYWCDDFKGDIAALKRLQGNGLWDVAQYEDPMRRAEGFNNIMIAAWPR